MENGDRDTRGECHVTTEAEVGGKARIVSNTRVKRKAWNRFFPIAMI